MQINQDRLWRRLDALAALTEPDRPWTRRSFTPRFLDGRAWLAETFRRAGLATRIDAGGNLIGRRDGRGGGLKPIVLGSHSDTVPSGGRYDGMLGVIAALEVAETLEESGRELLHPLEVIDFLAEEPSEFGLSCIGSRAMTGALSTADFARVRPDGMTLAQGLRLVGGDPEEVANAVRGVDSIAAYVELHIEQGRILETEDRAIGIVTDIVGIRREAWVVEGRSDHSGATPMPLRKDALVGASQVILAASAAARDWSKRREPLVATVGHLEIAPNAANAVPGRVELTLEVRSGNDAAVRAFGDRLEATTRESIAALGLRLTRREISHALPTPCSKAVQEAIGRAAAALGFLTRDLPSGAGHDGVFISRIGPVGMIFIPCLDGRSHAPEESITPEQAAKGANVLLGTLLELDGALS